MRSSLSSCWLQGFGCKVLAHDIRQCDELRAMGVCYVSKEELLQQAHVISLHCPLLPSTYHIIDAARWATADWQHPLQKPGSSRLLPCRSQYTCKPAPGMKPDWITRDGMLQHCELCSLYSRS